MNTHKAWVQTTFDKGAAGYGEKGCGYFDHFGKRLVELTEVQPGAAILDVACGKGAVLFAAAARVGKEGRAVGVDISSQMIEEAKKRSPVSWIQLQQMDAEDLLFPDHSFDVVFSGFCLFFLPDVHTALLEFKRVLKPSGRLAVSVWGDRSLLDSWLATKIHERGVSQRLSVQNLYSEGHLSDALSQAGFTHIRIFKESIAFFHESKEAWWDSLWTHAIRAQLEQLSSDDLESLKQEVFFKLGSGPVKDKRNAILAMATRY